MSLHDRISTDENERYHLLKNQAVLSDQVALRLAKESGPESNTLLFFEEGEDLVVQGEDSQEIYFILSGFVDIIINQRVIRTRKAGTIIGEMGALDATAKRSATVRASEPVSAIKLNYDEFIELLKEDDCYGWRQMSNILSSRLKQYSTKTRLQNDQIRVFIGSSSESSNVAAKVAKYLRKANIAAKSWEDGIFDMSGVILSRLLDEARSTDFAVFIYSNDDIVRSRGNQYATPRDNVHLEVGMFMGSLDDSERVVLLVPNNEKIKIPSDLGGFIYQVYNPLSEENIEHISLKIADKIRDLGPR